MTVTPNCKNSYELCNFLIGQNFSFMLLSQAFVSSFCLIYPDLPVNAIQECKSVTMNINYDFTVDFDATYILHEGMNT